MDITQLSIDQLKSLAYDTKKEIERQENNLAVIENQLANKVQADTQARIDEQQTPKEDPSPAPTEPKEEPSGDQPQQPGAGNENTN